MVVGIGPAKRSVLPVNPPLLELKTSLAVRNPRCFPRFLWVGIEFTDFPDGSILFNKLEGNFAEKGRRVCLPGQSLRLGRRRCRLSGGDRQLMATHHTSRVVSCFPTYLGNHRQGTCWR